MFKPTNWQSLIKRTINEKLNDSKNMPQIEILSGHKAVIRYGEERMLIAPPLAYDEIMKKVSEGRVITTYRIRNYLAQKLGADFTCPLTAGIFVNIAAHASVEQNSENPTPYHRTLKKRWRIKWKISRWYFGSEAAS